MLEFTTRAQAKRSTGLSYFGKINNGHKHEKAYKYNVLVYTLYLSPGKMSGYEVCPGRNKECTKFCLNKSGRNRGCFKNNRINNSRIKKTRLIFENREFTTRWMIEEIKSGIEKAKRIGYNFSIRLNNTSDISPEDFYIIENGTKLNILQIFPDVTFYDYTKVAERIELLKKYKNYDLTYSYNGYNLNTCKTMLKNNIRVAMVFKKVPDYYIGYKVINGDNYDMRYNDDPNIIIGLKYKKVGVKLDENIKFVIQ